ncbi:uncharacterized protein LOC124535107 [Vanessa cardui]|uniref:uncharacterized protein LOC124535107 n=1 Tax=Vanessa cardui TaxID=171605 RepID=UPI001F13A144|nr:uncharacterized protein LOC124535107 [Vanessa cardui]
MWIIIYMVTFAGVAHAGISKSDTFVYSHNIPRYLEANQSFAQAKQYIQNHLPQGETSYVTDEALAFGGLASVAGGLVQAFTIDPRYYEPTNIVEDYNNFGRANYSYVVKMTNVLLEDASEKIIPIINLMRSLCTREPYLGCNEAVDEKVRSNPYAYYMPARLLIHLGKVSKNVMRNIILLEKLLRDNEVVSYLSVHAKDRGLMTVVKRLSKAYVIMKRMGSFN